MLSEPQKPVVRLNADGTINKYYHGVRDAARDNGGVNETVHIRRSCNNEGRKHHGWKFRYATLRDKPDITEIPHDQPHVKKLPSVLIFDVETLPMEVFVWGLYKQRISHENIIQDWVMCSWSAKWLFDSGMMSDVLTPKEAVNRDDMRIMRSLWKLVEQADVVIAHNGLRFDVRRMNARFFMNGLRRPSPYQVIDTLKQAQRAFAFASHRLDYLGKLIANKGKIDTDFDLWKRCVAGDEEALKYMETYNREDVALLEDVYVEMRGWMVSHPNLSLYAEVDEPVCPTCLSRELEDCGDYGTAASLFSSRRCKQCGSIMRLRKSELTMKERERTFISVAR